MLDTSDKKLWIEAVENLETVAECEQVATLLKERLKALRPSKPAAKKRTASHKPKDATSEVTKAETPKADAS